MGFLDTVIKDSGNEFASIVSDGVAAGDVDNYVDTGSYIFNALVSGSVYGGIPGNKITALAGESSTGKTYFCLGVVQHFLGLLLTHENSVPHAETYFQHQYDLQMTLRLVQELNTCRKPAERYPELLLPGHDYLFGSHVIVVYRYPVHVSAGNYFLVSLRLCFIFC